jgi:hypothetical protein
MARDPLRGLYKVPLEERTRYGFRVRKAKKTVESRLEGGGE